MHMRLTDRIAIVVGAGQTPGPTAGTGKAAAISYAREGAAVFAIDRNPEAVAETVRAIVDEGGTAVAHVCDATLDADVAAAIGACVERFGRIDILHNNIGVSVA